MNRREFLRLFGLAAVAAVAARLPRPPEPTASAGGFVTGNKYIIVGEPGPEIITYAGRGSHRIFDNFGISAEHINCRCVLFAGRTG